MKKLHKVASLFASAGLAVSVSAAFAQATPPGADEWGRISAVSLD